MSSLTVVSTAPTEPVSLSEAKAQIRAATSEEDGLLAGYLIAARQYVEDYTGRALITRTYDYKIDWGWPRDDYSARICLPMPPFVAVTSISYIDANGATQTLAGSQYQQSVGDIFGLIVPAYGVSWPAVRNQVDAITVRYNAGYGSTSSSVPEPMRQAIMLLAAHWFANREPVNIGNIVTPIDFTVTALLSNYRTYF